MDLVIFPKNNLEKHFTADLTAFFNDNKINFEKDASFSMDCLRNIYRLNRELFLKIKMELSLFGFSFHSSVSSTFFPKDLPRNSIFLISNSEQAITPELITSLHLWGVLNILALKTKSSLNGFSFERLRQITEFCDESAYIQNGFLFFKDGDFIAGVTNDSVTVNENQQIEGFLPQVNIIDSDFVAEPLSVDDSKETSDDSENRGDSIENEDDAHNAALNPESLLPRPAFVPRFVEGSITIWIPFFVLSILNSLFTLDAEAEKILGKNNIVVFLDFFSLSNQKAATLLKDLRRGINDQAKFEKWEIDIRNFIKGKEYFESGNGITQGLLKEMVRARNFEADYMHLSSLNGFFLQISPNSPYKEKIDNCQFPLIDSQNYIASYLALWEIRDLSFFDASLYSAQMKEFVSDYSSVGSFLNPGVVISTLLKEISGQTDIDFYSCELEFKKAKILIRMPDFYKSVFSDCFKKNSNQSSIEMIKMREAGFTLEECGQKFQLTRERIRQVVDKFGQKANSIYTGLLNDLFRNADYLSICMAQHIFGLMSVVNSTKASTRFKISDQLGIILPEDRKKLASELIVFLKNKKSISVSEISNYSNAIHVPLYWRVRSDSKMEPADLSSNFYNSRKIDAIREYLAIKGENGIDFRKDMKEAMDYVDKRTAKAMKSERNMVSAVMREDVVLRDMSKYISTSFLKDDQIDAVKRVIEKADISNLPYGISAFVLFNNNIDFLENKGIDNPYFLYGIGAKLAIGNYVYSGRGLRIFPEKKIPLFEVVTKYIYEKGPIVSLTNLYDDLGLREVALEQMDEFTRYGTDSVVLISWLSLLPSELEYLKLLIDKTIQEKGFCMASDILESNIVYDSEHNGFLSRKKVGTSLTRLIYLIQYSFLSNGITGFHFSHFINGISLSNAPIETKEDLVNFHFSKKRFRREELNDFLRKCKLSTSFKEGDIFSSLAVYVDENMMALKRDVEVDEEEICLLDKIAYDRYNEEPVISANDVLIRAKIDNIHTKFADNPVGLVNAFSLNKSLHWISPINNLHIEDPLVRTLLANKSFFKDSRILLTDLIYMVIYKKLSGFLTFEQINNCLIKNEFISKGLSFEIIASIFKDSIEEGIVEIEK